jgi:ribonuclease HII
MRFREEGLDAGFADSKSLTAKQREHQRSVLMDGGARIGVGWVWPEEIDRLNIHHASLLAMTRAWEDLTAGAPDGNPVIQEIIVDGRFYPPAIGFPGRAVVRGDSLHREVQAASIIAKTTRDEWMIAYAGSDPRYGFERHKGYPTEDHLAALRRYGPCPIHRRSFRGVLSAG